MENNIFITLKYITLPLFLKAILLFLKFYFNKSFVLVKKREVFLISLCFFSMNIGYAQVGEKFKERFPGNSPLHKSIKGDLVIIGNTMLGVTRDDADWNIKVGNYRDRIPDNILELTTQANLSTVYTNQADGSAWQGGGLDGPKNQNYDAANNRKSMEYIDIDGDQYGKTYASSSANLDINSECKTIIYAGLYWQAIYPNDRSGKFQPDYTSNNYTGTARKKDWDSIYFKLPNDEKYTKLKADEIIMDGALKKFFNNDNKNGFRNNPYLCYKDVTYLLKDLDEANGTYFAANIRATKGRRNLGSTSGWNLVVIYEDKSLPSKQITTYDGFVGIERDYSKRTYTNLEFKIDGFKTPANIAKVNATIGIVAQDGELGFDGEAIKISSSYDANNNPTGYMPLSNSLNPADNIFNSSMSILNRNDVPIPLDQVYRNPFRANTFGFDTDLIKVNEGILKTSQNDLNIQLTTTGDAYAVSIVTLAIDIVAPLIELTEEIRNENNDLLLDGANLNLGQTLTYKLGFKNVGDDNVKNFRISYILSENVTFDYSTSGMNLPAGVIYESYNSETRTIVFSVSNDIVKKDDPKAFFTFKAKINNCIVFDQKHKDCNVEIENKLLGTYTGDINKDNFSTSTKIANSTNSCGTIDPIKFLTNAVFCDKESNREVCFPATILAENGFESYSWSRNIDGSSPISNEQTILVENQSELGIYYVTCTPYGNPDPTQGQYCAPLKQIINVIEFGTTTFDPFVKMSPESVNCSNNIKLSKFFLCRESKMKISAQIPDGAIALWEKSNCPLQKDTNDCPDEMDNCNWNQLEGSEFIEADKGKYRLTLIFDNNILCSYDYYFNVYDEIIPTATTEDIYCLTAGKITVTNPLGNSKYKYSLDGENYQSSEILTVNYPGKYTVYILANDNSLDECPLEISNIVIKKETIRADYEVKNITCFGLLDGSIEITVTGKIRLNGSYTYNLWKDGQKISENITASPLYKFEGLSAGFYKATVTTNDGCEEEFDFEITSPAEFRSSAIVTKNLTCTEAEITVTTIGGTPDYRFEIDVFDEDNIQKVSDSYIITDTIVGQRIFKMPMYNEKITFVLRVTDDSKCKVIDLGTFTFDPLQTLGLNFNTITHVNCNGFSTGAVTVNASGALGNYSYSLLNEKGEAMDIPPINTSPATFTNLPAGNYEVHVVSEDCSDDFPFKIEEPLLIVPSIEFDDVTCAGFANVTIKVSATGGTGKLQYGISTLPNRFFDSGVFREIKAGIYIISVKDEKNCIIRDTLTIVDPEPLVATVIESSIIQELCIGGKSGAFNIEIRGGTAPYSTSLDSATGPFILGQLSFLNLSGGKHKVYIQDRYKCQFELPIELILPKIKLNTSATITYNCEDNRPANQITAQVDASNTDATLVLFSLDGLGVKQHDNVFKNVSPGSHFVRAEHVDGCITDSNIVIVNEPNPPLTVSLELGRLNEIRIIINGGSGIYPKIKVNNEESNFIEKYTYYSSGTYTVTVTDSNGCTATATKPFEFVGLDVPNIFTPNGSGINDSWKPVHQEIYPDILIRIYDRYGREVAVLRYEESWDGTYKGVELPTGDYWYVIKLRNTKDDREFVGNVTLYR